MKSLNIVFAGTPAFALPCLEALVASPHTIQTIYTQPDRPSGRGRKLQASAVKEWGEQHAIPIYQPLNFKEKESVEELATLAPDVMIVIAYGIILPRVVLEIPRLGCINVHASLLPRWRGASPIQHAILYGDTESGVSIMQMDVGMDTGAVLTEAACPIENDTAEQLHDRLATLAVSPLLETLTALGEGITHPEPQNNLLATYAPKINKEDAAIQWQKSATEIDRQIRAFNPWPITYTLAGDVTLRIYSAQVVHKDHKAMPGTVLELNKEGMLVAAGENALLIDRLQFPGGKAMSVAEWLCAGRNQLYPGLILASTI